MPTADSTVARLSLLFNGDYGPLVTQATAEPDDATDRKKASEAFCLVPLSYVTYTAYFSNLSLLKMLVKEISSQNSARYDLCGSAARSLFLLCSRRLVEEGT